MCVEMHVCVECVCGMVCCVWCVCMTYGLRVRRVVSVRVACVRMVGRRVLWCVSVCVAWSLCVVGVLWRVCVGVCMPCVWWVRCEACVCMRACVHV